MERKKVFRCLSCGKENPIGSVYCSNCGQKIAKRPLSVILCSGIGFALGSYLVIAGIAVLIIVSPVLKLDLYGLESLLYSSMMYNLLLVFLGFGLAFSSYGIWRGKSWSYNSIHFIVGFLIITEILIGKKYGFDMWSWLFLIFEIVLLVFVNVPRARHFLSGHGS